MRRYSKATANTEGACPQCGGRSFAPKRTRQAKALGLALGAAPLLLMPKNNVQCVTCGAKYKRG